MIENDPETIAHVRRVREVLVDPTVDHPLYDAFLVFLRDHEYHPHYLRFAQTMAALLNTIGDAALTNPAATVICETGELCPISWFLRDRGFQVSETLSDLRYEIDVPSESADIVLSLEVIEHIKDQREENIDDLILFNGSGVRAYAKEISRVLKPGGYLALTTPNPNSLITLRRLIDFDPPMVFRGHAQEYTRKELLHIFRHLEAITYTSFYSYFFPFDGQSMAADFAERIGWDPEHRGDCHFFIFRKQSDR